MNKMLLDLPARLETERLVLRPYQAGDSRWYYPASQRNRAHLARYEAGNVLMRLDSVAAAEIAVRELAAAWVARSAFFLGAFHKQSGEWVGQIYVGPVNWALPEFDLGYVVDVACEGQGYGTEAACCGLRFAFEHLRAQRVHLECDDTNTRSARLAERCGLRREGHFRSNKRSPSGEISGTLHYGMLREEFEACKQA